jgi:3-oxoadipate enol-lactonase
MAGAPELSYQWDGPSDAPVLVLSHALGTSRAMWEPQAQRLASRFRILRFDHRGHGASPVPPGPYRIHDLGADFLRLLDRLRLKRVKFAGLSLGGLVGIWLGANASDRIDRLILCCTAARMPRPEDFELRASRVREEGLEPLADQIIGRWFTPKFFNEQPQEAARIRALLTSTNPEGYASTCDALAAMDQRDQLRRITAPTLVIAGSEDQSTPVAKAEEIVGGIDGARLAVVQGAAHLTNIEQPDRFTELLVEHLQPGSDRRPR